MLSHSRHLPFLVSTGTIPAASLRGRHTDAAEVRQGVAFHHLLDPDATLNETDIRDCDIKNRSVYTSSQNRCQNANKDTIRLSDLIAIAGADISGWAP